MKRLGIVLLLALAVFASVGVAQADVDDVIGLATGINSIQAD
ncbi:MAG TPA: hypothetical protein VIE37_09980 [Methylomirabilota bacterium]|jgi:hypothetical protein